MQEFMSFVGKNWLHITVVFALVVIAIDLHLFRVKLKRFQNELYRSRKG